MPTYEYECERCSHKFEIRKEMKYYNTSEKCPRCHVVAKRLISAGTGFILEGSDWPSKEYRNDKTK